MRMLNPLSPCPSTCQPQTLVVHGIFMDALQYSCVILPLSPLQTMGLFTLEYFTFLKTLPLCACVCFRNQKTVVALGTCKQHQCFRGRRQVLEHNTNREGRHNILKQYYENRLNMTEQALGYSLPTWGAHQKYTN